MRLRQQYSRHPGESRDLRPHKIHQKMLPEIPAFAGMTALLICALTLTSCGVQRPLIRPSDIPAYEQKQREKREKIEQEQRDDAEKAAERAAATTQPEPAK